MTDEAMLGYSAIGVVVVLGLAAISNRGIHRRAAKDIAINTTINNAIIDLYESGFIRATGGEGTRGVVLVPNHQAPISGFQAQVLAYGFNGVKESLTTQEFHSNIYRARPALVKLIESAEGLDSTTKPSHRIYSDRADADSLVVLPLLILGTPEGSHFSGNPAYSDSGGDYVGSGDFGGDGGGDSGGGDGGGGGGD